jgi:hypothetical protein
MSQAPHASCIPGEQPYCVVVQLPMSLRRSSESQNPAQVLQERSTFFAEIREHISNGRVILVKGWTPELRLEFTADDIGIIRPTIDQQVQWQGKTNYIVVNIVILINIFRCHCTSEIF